LTAEEQTESTTLTHTAYREQGLLAHGIGAEPGDFQYCGHSGDSISRR